MDINHAQVIQHIDPTAESSGFFTMVNSAYKTVILGTDRIIGLLTDDGGRNVEAIKTCCTNPINMLAIYRCRSTMLQ
eukprot:scaffold282990_cov42-Prasinocladus_malaysianus.AAC.1